MTRVHDKRYLYVLVGMAYGLFIGSALTVAIAGFWHR